MLINKLLAKGFTKGQLAQLLGNSTPALQLRKDQVLVSTACDVQRLYSRLEKNNFTDAKKYQPAEVLPKNTYRIKPGVLMHKLPD